MSDAMLDRLRRAAGLDSVRREPGGMARVTPTTTDAVAAVLGIASAEGWRVSVEGGSTWRAEAVPADVVLVTRGLDEVGPVLGGEQVVDTGAGATLDRVRRDALDHGAWIALDPPGRPDRTIGSVLATGTAGPLRHRFESVLQQVSAITVVTGDGRVVELADPATERAGSLTPHVGGFGALGVITRCQLRLRQLARADASWMILGPRDALTAAARSIDEAALPVAALELFSPALAMTSDWVLAARILGDIEMVAETGRQLARHGGLSWQELPPERQVLLWGSAARAVTSVPVTLRLGVLAAGIDVAIDLIAARLGEGMLSGGPASGGLRWSGVADVDPIRDLRRELAAREIPVTLERAPWRVRRAVGHLGAYREPRLAAIDRLQRQWDPAGVLVTAVGAAQDA